MNEALDELTARIMAVASVLIDHNLCTVDDIDRRIVASRQMIDQKRADERERSLSELREHGPIGQMFAQMFAGSGIDPL